MGTPLSRIRCRAGTFSPIAAMASAPGPMKVIPASAQARANSWFSLRKPYPGWIASAPVLRAAAMMASARR